ncbi:MAG: cohesin domain-containing protein [Lachnospiraceae bacterium]
MYQGNLKRTGAVAFAIVLCILSGSRVYAAGSVKISADQETAAVGDTVTVSVKAENPAGAADAPQISVEYDANRLSFLECDKEYGGGGGGLITLSDTEADISFSVLSGGTAEVTVSAVLGGDGAEVPTDTVQIAVDGEDTAAAAGGGGQTETGVEEGTIMSSDGTKVVSTVFADEFMPSLFHKTTVTYEEQMVEAAQFDMGDIVLLYVTDTTGNNGVFNLYDQTTGGLSDFRTIQGIENRFIIVLPADQTVSVPTGFTKATLQWNEQTLEAYMIAESASEGEEEDTAISNEDVSSADFFLLYAISSEGNKGWYLYDQAEGTYQRYLQAIRTTTDENGNVIDTDGSVSDSGGYKVQSNRRLLVICIMAAILLILLIIMLNMFLKLRDYQSYDYIDEEDEEEGDGPIRASKLADIQMNGESQSGYGKDGYAQITSGRTDGEADDDLEMIDDYEDDEEDDFFQPRRKEKKEKKTKKEKPGRKDKSKFEEPQAIDWSELENTMKDSLGDERRPRGNRTEDLPPMYREEIREQGGEPAAESERPVNEQPAPQKTAPRQPEYEQQSFTQPAPQTELDLDEDFEFEFINLEE